MATALASRRQHGNVGSPLLRGTPAQRIAEIERLRRRRITSPAIARQLGMPNSTVTKVLRRLGLNRLTTLDPPTPVMRYQRGARASCYTKVGCPAGAAPFPRLRNRWFADSSLE